MPKDFRQLNKNTHKIFRHQHNVSSFFGKGFDDTVIKEDDVNCGLGRKSIYLRKTKNAPLKINYPFNFGGIKVNNKHELEKLINIFLYNKYGEGYMAYLVKGSRIEVLAAPYRKQEKDCKLNIIDYITLNDVVQEEQEPYNLCVRFTEFYTTDGQSTYTVSEIDGKNIVVVGYGENQILDKSKYTHTGDKITFDTFTPTQKAHVIVLYTY